MGGERSAVSKATAGLVTEQKAAPPLQASRSVQLLQGRLDSKSRVTNLQNSLNCGRFCS